MKNLLKKIVPKFIFDCYYWCWALLGAIIYGFPAKKIKVIGVTGTNGKSTVVFLISRILEEAGYAVAALSSIQFKIKEKTWPNNLKMTMPGRMKIQRFLNQAVKAGCQYAVLEVTSEGIKQFRHKFIDFEAAVLTNLTPEHLESHGNFENYKKAKAKLFQSLRPDGKAIVNLDDSQADYFLGLGAGKKYGYRIKNQLRIKYGVKIKNTLKLVQAENIQLTENGISFLVQGVSFNSGLLGEFNVYNSLAAITAGLAENISLDIIKSALGKAQGIPGRLEIVIKEPFMVVVDYAHTPDALKKVYQTLKDCFKGHLIGVLGAAGGGRDKWKRPELGKIAEQYLDEIIITNEDPYDENPEEIIEQIAQGITRKQPEKIIERRQAIKRALSLAQPGDLVIITGKGCESWMCLAQGKKIPWDDRQITREEFNKLKA